MCVWRGVPRSIGAGACGGRLAFGGGERVFLALRAAFGRVTGGEVWVVADGGFVSFVSRVLCCGRGRCVARVSPCGRVAHCV